MAKRKEKSVIESTQKKSKTYEYKKEGVTLSFSLDVSTKKDASVFLELLKAAQKELEHDLENEIGK